MTKTPRRYLVFEVERIQTVRRRVAAHPSFCDECRRDADFVDLSELARTFEVSVAEAVLQLRVRRVHMQHMANGNIVVCAESLLIKTDPDNQILVKSLPPSDPLHLTFSSE